MSQHDFIEVSRSRYDSNIDEVVRWCSRCGGVVVDLESDGRVIPGARRAWQAPDATKYVKCVDVKVQRP